ncbi:MAG: tryptophan--tRNA ligase [bacterium]|nr:tryptophan--tRNA ligase [bacterium]
MHKKRLLSGIKPTGKMHLGNYLGAVSNWVRLQEEFDSCFMIADLHALTTVYEHPEELKKDKIDLAVDLLSAGIDPEKSCLFFQSDVLEHSELHLILSMITPLSWVTRVPSYRGMLDEEKGSSLNTYGFLGYPVLQAADILLYKGDVVPVGKDQLPHLELTREVCRRFNYLYANIFPEPEDRLTNYPVIPGVDGRKMSKSYQNTIAVSHSEKETGNLIMKMLTDPARKRRTDHGNPDICPLYEYHKIYNTKIRQQVIADQCRSAEIGCVDCKKECVSLINESLREVRKRREYFLQNPQQVNAVLKDGAKKARVIAGKTINEVRKAVGLI